MVVDDEVSLRSVLDKMLTMAGYQPILAPDGIEALRLCRERSPDLIIVDLFMPQKDGIKTIIELRKYRPEIPIIAMSGGGKAQLSDLLDTARLLGAVATIEKPFELKVMINLVARLIGGS
jgi:CheY-like chemotaxis protein